MPVRLLLDANVLIALSEPRDELYDRAIADLERFRQADLVTTMAALMEACLVLREGFQRTRLHRVIARCGIRLYPLSDPDDVCSGVFEWMRKYAEHQPDWTDALYAVLSGREHVLRVWTYDSEFVTIWRRPDGSRIPLAVRR